jgi:hypothetical protein
MERLSEFWTRELRVKRLVGSGPYGEKYDPEVVVMCRLKHEVRLVRDSNGKEVVSQSRASMSIDTAAIPPESLVQMPGDSVWRKTISEGRHVGGFDRSPDYYSIDIA